MVPVCEEEDYNLLNFNISANSTVDLVYNTGRIFDNNVQEKTVEGKTVEIIPVSASCKPSDDAAESQMMYVAHPKSCLPSAGEIFWTGTTKIEQKTAPQRNENLEDTSLFDQTMFSSQTNQSFEISNLKQSLIRQKSATLVAQDKNSSTDEKGNKLFDFIDEGLPDDTVSYAQSAKCGGLRQRHISRSLTDFKLHRSLVDINMPDPLGDPPASRHLIRSIFEGRKSLSDIEVLGEEDEQDSSTNDMYYEEIEPSAQFDASFNKRGCTYLYPRSDASFDCGDIAASVQDSYRHHVERDGKKFLVKGSLLIARGKEACCPDAKPTDACKMEKDQISIDKTVGSAASDNLKSLKIIGDGGWNDNDLSCLLKGTTIAYDKNGDSFYVPTNLLVKYGDPSDEKWFYPLSITPRQATLFLDAVHTQGCFVIYKLPSVVVVGPSASYNLSVCLDSRGNRDVVHYRIVENINGDVMIKGHDHSFMTLRELVHYFRCNKSSLATRLRR